jgi:hypothetical protein
MTTTTTDRAALLAQTIADMQRQADDLEAMAESLPRSQSEPWLVISMHGMPLRFDIEAGGAVTGVHSSTFEQATQLTRVNAEHLAPLTKDGNGEPGRAMKRRAAIRVAAEDLRVVVALLQSKGVA